MNRQYRPPTAWLLGVACVAFIGLRAAAAEAAPREFLQGVEGSVKTEGLNVVARWSFRATVPEGSVGLCLEKPEAITDWRLNGKAVPVPFEGVRPTRIPGIPANMLVAGENTLEAFYKLPEKEKEKGATVPAPVRLLALTAADLDFQTGPVLGAAGQDYFTVACRTSIHAKVTLEANGTLLESPVGLIHFFRITGLKAGSRCECVLTAEVPGTQTRKTVKIEGHTLPEKAPFTFAVVGDNRSNPQDWAKVSDATALAQPVFVVHTGDLVADGRNDALWDREYFGPARKMLAAAPVFPVLGNHEADSPIIHRFYGGKEPWKNWTLKIGPVLFIGVDGATGWAASSANVRWLEDVLSASREPFIFFASHYPAWSSGPHGALKGGVPGERAVREAQQVILPLLAKYHAAAFFAGHDHFYERSECDGVSIIITGGAGAPRYEKSKNEREQNPHSKVFFSKLHYCLVDVTEQQCKLRVLTPEGVSLDTFQWAARPVGAGTAEPVKSR